MQKNSHVHVNKLYDHVHLLLLLKLDSAWLCHQNCVSVSFTSLPRLRPQSRHAPGGGWPRTKSTLCSTSKQRLCATCQRITCLCITRACITQACTTCTSSICIACLCITRLCTTCLCITCLYVAHLCITRACMPCPCITRVCMNYARHVYA